MYCCFIFRVSCIWGSRNVLTGGNGLRRVGPRRAAEGHGNDSALHWKSMEKGNTGLSLPKSTFAR